MSTAQTFDLRPAASALAEVVRGTTPEQLTDPTPCEQFSVADLLDHIDGLALAFTQAARKETAPDEQPPAPDGSSLVADWATTLPQRLEDLAQAWADPSAWTGRTAAGGLEMDGTEAGLVALDELVLHGWDLAKATGQEFDPGPESVAGARLFVDQFSGPGTEEMRQGLFDPQVPVPPGAQPVEELVALAGRDPDWAPEPREQIRSSTR